MSGSRRFSRAEPMENDQTADPRCRLQRAARKLFQQYRAGRRTAREARALVRADLAKTPNLKVLLTPRARRRTGPEMQQRRLASHLHAQGHTWREARRLAREARSSL